MEFGKHLEKGIWAFADKSLPALYGVGFIFFVVRVLPAKEFGSYVLVQTLFTIATAFCGALALQPLTKFAAETKKNGPYIVASLVLSILFYVLATIVVILFQPVIVQLLDRSGEANLSPLLNYLPLMFLTSLYRMFAISLLQASYRVKQIFWIDAVYFLGSLLMIVVAQELQHFSTALDLVMISVVAQACSTLLALVLTYMPMNVSLSFHKDAFSRMWNFGKYSFGANVNSMIMSQMDVFFISTYAGITSLAIYNAAKLFTRFFDVVSQVLQMFIMPIASQHHANNENKKIGIIIEKATCFSLLLLVPVFIVILFFPSVILHILYGNKYLTASSYLQVFGFLALTTPWNAVAASVLNGIGKVKLGFLLGIGFALFSLGSYILFIKMIGSLGVAIALVSSTFISAVVLTYYTRRFIHFKLKNILLRANDVLIFIKGYLTHNDFSR